MEAQYLRFLRGRADGQSFVGRQPAHLPIHKPWPRIDDEYIGFFMQIGVNGILPNPEVVCLQFYQPIDLGDDPTPFVIPITGGNPLNKTGDTLVIDRYGEYGIEFEIQDEPDVAPDLDSEEFLKLMQPKFGGHDPWRSIHDPKKRYIGQITEHPVKFNFGGTTCVLYISNTNDITVEMR